MRIIFFGTPQFSVPSFNILLKSEDEIMAVVTQPDKKRGRGHILSYSPIKEQALNRGVCIFQPKNIKDPQFITGLSRLKPNLIVVVAYGKILPLDILRLPTLGCINMHASLLPKYRGASPIQWSILNDEKITGITTILMDEGLDTGDILLQEQTEISDEDTSDTLSERLSDLGATLLQRTIRGVKEETIAPVPQKGIPTYAPPLKKEDGIVNWFKTSREIYNCVRALYPWPCAYCYLNKERIKIIKVKILEGSGIPRRLEHVNKEIVVGTGKGLISILELQPEGKRPMSAQAFLMGRRFKKGVFFDEPQIV